MAQLNPQSSLQLPVQKEPGAPELSSSPATASLSFLSVNLIAVTQSNHIPSIYSKLNKLHLSYKAAEAEMERTKK